MILKGISLNPTLKLKVQPRLGVGQAEGTGKRREDYCCLLKEKGGWDAEVSLGGGVPESAEVGGGGCQEDIMRCSCSEREYNLV